MDCICRCCLTEHPNIYNIFEDGIVTKLSLCSSLNIAEDDDLPKIVCELCLRKIEDSYEFRQTCQKSDAILRDWIGTLEGADISLDADSQVEIITAIKEESVQEIVNSNEIVEDTVPKEALQDDEGITNNEEYAKFKVNNNKLFNQVEEDNQERFQGTEDKVVKSLNALEVRTDNYTIPKSCEHKKDIKFKEKESNKSPELLSNEDSTYKDVTQDSKQTIGKVLKNLKASNRSQMTCKDCNMKFSTHCALMEHESTHEKNEKFSCEHCNKTFTRLIYLTRHLRRHSGLKKHACAVCKSTFYDSSSLKVHVRIHTGEKPYECEQCRKRFVQRSQLNAHVRVHSHEKPFECDICFKRFSHTTLLQTHKKTHLPEKENICSVCQKGFTLPAQLKAHMRWHSVQETKYQCNECGRTFFHNTGLIYHMRTHSGERPYVCTICCKSFLTKTHLCTHYRTHTKHKPPPKTKCPHCGKGCFSNSELRVHLRTHTGERPFECTICKKRFLLNVHLVVHMRTHTGEKPYLCSECGKSFASLSTRKKHMFRHTGEKNFLCDLCGKGFPQAGIRNSHRKVHFSRSNANSEEQQKEIREEDTLE